ncbi:MAG: hypothetical protein JJT75_08020 [Opitutales bacterium]|nr:hypothetical protein [Opitutales bacterium]MCH8540905.1 hypothetical protein [Opitutales bacterium]
MQEGDLVVRYTDSVLSRTSVRFSKEDRRFSHVGILWQDESEDWRVTHALPRGEGKPEVFSEALEKFLEPAIRHGYFRWKTSLEESRDLAHAAARTAKEQNLPFDRSFDLEREEAVYCTELIWRLAGVVWEKDIVPEKSLFNGRLLISMEDLLHSPYLEEIFAKL